MRVTGFGQATAINRTGRFFMGMKRGKRIGGHITLCGFWVKGPVEFLRTAFSDFKSALIFRSKSEYWTINYISCSSKGKKDRLLEINRPSFVVFKSINWHI